MNTSITQLALSITAAQADMDETNMPDGGPSNIHLVNPQLSNDDVMYRSGHFLPGVVIVALVKHTLDRACRETRKKQNHFSALL